MRIHIDQRKAGRFIQTCFVTLLLLACNQTLGWFIPDVVDHRTQLEAAAFVGIVEVTDVTDSGRSKDLRQDGVGFREMRLSLRVISIFKGEEEEQVVCDIYREPTWEELAADGKSREKVRMILLDFISDEVLHALLASPKIGDRMLVYLKSGEGGFVPVSEALESANSLIPIEESRLRKTTPVDSKDNR